MRKFEEGQEIEQKEIYKRLLNEFQNEWEEMKLAMWGQADLDDIAFHCAELASRQKLTADEQLADPRKVRRIEKEIDQLNVKTCMALRASKDENTESKASEAKDEHQAMLEFARNLAEIPFVQDVIFDLALNAGGLVQRVDLAVKWGGKWYFIEAKANRMKISKKDVESQFSTWDCKVKERWSDDVNTYFLLQCPELSQYDNDPELDYREEE